MSRNTCASIVGASEIAREGLKRILSDHGLTVDNISSGCVSLVNGNCQDSPDHVIIIDATSGIDGVAACSTLREHLPRTRLVVLMDESQLDSVQQAFRAGADGVLAKQISCQPLIRALELVALGEKVVPSQFIDLLSVPAWSSMANSWGACQAETNLSDREVEILRCLVDGSANKIISRQLHIAEATVKVHIKAILRKLQLANRTQAAIWAVSHGLNNQKPGSERVTLN